jgi:predicted nucleic acid-binding protein
MKEYVLDANAVLRYLGVGELQSGERVHGLFEQAERNQATLSMSVINLGEALYILLKYVDEQRAVQYLQTLQHVVTVIDANARGRDSEASMQTCLCGQFRRFSGPRVEGHARFSGSFVCKSRQISQVDETPGIACKDPLDAWIRLRCIRGVWYVS